MKVFCVNNEYVGLSITVGKWYELTNKEIFTEQFNDNAYIIYDDRFRCVKLDQKYFKTQKEIREEKLSELGI